MSNQATIAAYASYLKENHLVEFTRESLRLCKEADLPLLKFYAHLSDEELLQLSLKGTEDGLNVFINGNMRANAEAQMRLWESDQLPDATFKKRDIKIDDLVISYRINKQNLINFLPKYTQELAAALSIIAEVDLQYSVSFQIMMNTYMKIHEEDMQNLLHEVESTNKELNDFAHIISHDLKAPLRSINSITDWLTTDYDDKLDEEGKKMLKMLSDKAVAMHDMINGVLLYSKSTRSTEIKETVNVADTVSDVIKLIDVPASTSIEIGALPTMYTEKTKLFQVFQNLLNNAIKFIDKPKGEIKVDCEAIDGFYRFSVKDNGPGIGEKYQEKIFQIFQTAKGDETKTVSGVGLAIVKKIIENAGGKVWVKSKIDEGSCFYFTIPIGKLPGGKN